jgi:hypothetical protein
MFGFLKKIFGLPTEAEVAAAKAPYKIEPVVVNNKTGDVVIEPTVSTPEPVAPVVVVEEVKVTVNDQITDAVTQAPAKKPRKPRTPKAEKPAKEKAAKPAKIAAKKVSAKRSKKV